MHAEKARKHEENPTDGEGLYADGRSLKEELVSEAWDFVTIQQASIKSHDPATYSPYAPWLQAYISRHAGGAQLLVHQTWAYRVDDPRFSKADPAPGEPKTQEEIYREPAGLGAEYARFLQEPAHGAVQARMAVPSGN